MYDGKADPQLAQDLVPSRNLMHFKENAKMKSSHVALVLWPNTNVKNLGSKDWLLGFQSQLYHWLDLWCWAGFPTPLSLGFITLNCKMGVELVPSGKIVVSVRIVISFKYSEQSLAEQKLCYDPLWLLLFCPFLSSSGVKGPWFGMEKYHL